MFLKKTRNAEIKKVGSHLSTNEINLLPGLFFKYYCWPAFVEVAGVTYITSDDSSIRYM